jgi:hypothetical protein
LRREALEGWIDLKGRFWVNAFLGLLPLLLKELVDTALSKATVLPAFTRRAGKQVSPSLLTCCTPSLSPALSVEKDSIGSREIEEEGD